MKKFALRWFLVFSVTIVVAMIAVSHVGFMSVLRQMENQPSDSFSTIIMLLRESIQDKNYEESRQALDELSRRINTGIQMLGPDDARVSPSLRAAMAREGVALRREYSGIKVSLCLYVPVSIEGKGWVLKAGPFMRPFGPDLTAYMYMGLLVLLILIISSTAVTVPMFNRLRKLERAARTIADGDLGARVPIPADDALVGFVAQQFNTMAMRVEQLMASQKMMLQAVSHELRTPTARIRFGLEMLESTTDPAERARRLEGIDEDLTEVDDMVEELLLFNKMEALGRDIETVSTPVLPALTKLVEKRGFMRPGIKVTLDMADRDICVNADPRAFVRATGNLLSNALRFTRSQVVIEVSREDGFVRVSVCDDGPGVPPAQRQTIFEPFKRLDNSRNRESGGAGLGLAIVSSIVTAHGGRVEVSDAATGGAAFTVWWPVS